MAAGRASRSSSAVWSRGKAGSSNQVQAPVSSFSKRRVTSPSHRARAVTPSTGGAVWVEASTISLPFVLPQADSSSVDPSKNAVRRRIRFIMVPVFSFTFVYFRLLLLYTFAFAICYVRFQYSNFSGKRKVHSVNSPVPGGADRRSAKKTGPRRSFFVVTHRDAAGVL